MKHKKRTAKTDKFGVRTSRVTKGKKERTVQTLEGKAEKTRAKGIKGGVANVVRGKTVDAVEGTVRKRKFKRDSNRAPVTGIVKDKTKSVGQKRAGRMVERAEKKQDRMDKKMAMGGKVPKYMAGGKVYKTGGSMISALAKNPKTRAQMKRELGM
jgi:hypothetical protein